MMLSSSIISRVFLDDRLLLAMTDFQQITFYCMSPFKIRKLARKAIIMIHILPVTVGCAKNNEISLFHYKSETLVPSPSLVGWLFYG